jgi:hypothetical protein
MRIMPNVDTGTSNERRTVQVKNVSKGEAITGLSIPLTPKLLQFRTKARTLVATGYEKVERDEDGVVRVYFRHVHIRNLVEVEAERGFFDKNPCPAKYNSKDAAKVEFLRPFTPLYVLNRSGLWKAAAADLYVDGVPVYDQGSQPKQKPK